MTAMDRTESAQVTGLVCLGWTREGSQEDNAASELPI